MEELAATADFQSRDVALGGNGGSGVTSLIDEVRHQPQ